MQETCRRRESVNRPVGAWGHPTETGQCRIEGKRRPVGVAERGIEPNTGGRQAPAGRRGHHEILKDH